MLWAYPSPLFQIIVPFETIAEMEGNVQSNNGIGTEQDIHAVDHECSESVTVNRTYPVLPQKVVKISK